MDAQNKYTSVLVAYLAGVATDLPTVSPYARSLSRVSRSIAISEAALIQAYLTDPFLCAKLCGVANSMFFNYDHEAIYTLQDSLERVGFQYARNLLREAPELPQDLNEVQVSAYWAHCMSVAYGAKRIAAKSKQPLFHDDVAYLIGMVHDIGYLLQIHYSPQMLPAVAAALDGGEPAGTSDFHTHHGEELVRYWSLPTPAVAAVKYHHDPGVCGERHGRWLSQVIGMSEMLLGVKPSESSELSDNSCFIECRRDLGVTEDDLHTIQKEAGKVYDECMRVALTEDGLLQAKAITRLKVVK